MARAIAQVEEFEERERAEALAAASAFEESQRSLQEKYAKLEEYKAQAEAQKQRMHVLVASKAPFEQLQEVAKTVAEISKKIADLDI